MLNPWLLEFWRFLGLLLAAGGVGLLAGHGQLGVVFGLLLYLGIHLRNLYRLQRWLQRKGGYLPDAAGIWGEVYYHLHRLQKRNRKRKKRLASMLNRFRESTAAMPDATVVLDADGAIEWWNDAATRVFGLRYPQDTGQALTNLVRHPDFRPYLEQGDFSAPVQFPSPADANIMLSVRVVPYGKNQRLVVARDVTRLHLLEQMRRDFIANVSHELRTPLTVVTGYVESMMDADDEALQPWQRSLEAMHQQSARMQQIVTDLLLLSRLETDSGGNEDQEVDVPGLIGMIRDDAVALSRGRHTINVDVERGLWLKGSRSELRSAFSNLVYNAVRYTPDGGHIDVRWYADDNGAHFEVQDTGVGIAAHHLPRLTERFYRVDVGRSREMGGTGLGLAIVKHVLMRHGTELRIESELGKGSLFAAEFAPERIVRAAVPKLQAI
ncbi:MAG: phosphate regulon sensor histidine kinase PhoR [Gammaproteobacteria bacterium]